MFTLTNAHGLEVRVITYGAIIVSLRVPDRAGRLDDVVLGFDDLDGYLSRRPYFGAVVGRYANRIAGGRFTLDGAYISSPSTTARTTCTAASRGFDKVIWHGGASRRRTRAASCLPLHQPGRRGGLPRHAARARSTYTLTDADELIGRLRRRPPTSRRS